MQTGLNSEFACAENLELPLLYSKPAPAAPGLDLRQELEQFQEFGKRTQTFQLTVQSPHEKTCAIPVLVNEFWTAKQRQASSLHEVSYRACFKPQLPRFFIERLTRPGEVVYDPFMGRGTTPLEAALLGRIPFGNDANPLSLIMTRPRLNPPTLRQVEERLAQIDLQQRVQVPEELLVFYHPETLRAICSLREHLLARRKAAASDSLDEWVGLVGLNRLTGHSSGFFSVYTLPPNQAVSVRSQAKINLKRKQSPPKRDVARLILKKTKQLLGDVDQATRRTLSEAAARALLLTSPAEATSTIPADSISLVVTSPPFLNVVQYAADNWLRCWFMGIDPAQVHLTTPVKLERWQVAMMEVFRELHRVLKPGGHVAFEVGEVHRGQTKLEEAVLPCGLAAGFEPLLVLINDQQFTKTANCWGIDNMSKGTNTNRVVVFRKHPLNLQVRR